jgi:hypothetical protein
MCEPVGAALKGSRIGELDPKCDITSVYIAASVRTGRESEWYFFTSGAPSDSSVHQRSIRIQPYLMLMITPEFMFFGSYRDLPRRENTIRAESFIAGHGSKSLRIIFFGGK